MGKVMNLGHALTLLVLPSLMAAPGGSERLLMTARYPQALEAFPSVLPALLPTEEPIAHVFGVPVPNTIGTNDLNNAITLVELAKDRPKLREVRRNFKKYATGGEMVFLPVFSPDTIGYTQTRALNLLNIETGAYQRHLIAETFEIMILDVAVSDWSTKRFLFHLTVREGVVRHSEVVLVDLSGSTAQQRARHEIHERLPPMEQGGPAPVLLGRTTFYFDRSEKPRALHALDEQLRPAEHPLLRVFNAPPGIPEAGLPRLHPRLPLAVYHDGATLWAATWDASGPALTYPLLSAAPDDLQFSPDGKWLAFLDSSQGKRVLVAMPVDSALPHRLGPPLLLRGAEDVSGWNGQCAWVSTPSAIACTVRSYRDPTGGKRHDHALLTWNLSPGNIEKAAP